MLNPPLNQLTSQIKSKYLIATTAAKRAREIDEQPETELLSEYHSFKPVGRALEKIDWLKWNPINMMNIMLQTVEKGFSKSTKLELHELFIGNIAYISIFLILVVFIFKKKNI